VFDGRLLKGIVKTPVEVPPWGEQFDLGAGDVPQQMPIAVKDEPPLDVTLAPSTALLYVIELEVGEVTVGLLG